MTRAYEVLRQNHVQHISAYPQTLPEWNPNAAGIKAFYFQDPDGHPLEVLQFPAGKGDPNWQQANGKLFWELTTRRSPSPTPTQAWRFTARCWACVWPARATITASSRST